ncbi:unnamed protein product, partial [Phaeothamnion confervicola]
MPDRTPSSRITLPAGRYAVFADAAGTRIACADGTLWITQYADTRDIVLRAGDSFVVDRDGKVVVSAVSDSVFAAIPPAQAVQPAAWRRL